MIIKYNLQFSLDIFLSKSFIEKIRHKISTSTHISLYQSILVQKNDWHSGEYSSPIYVYWMMQFFPTRNWVWLNQIVDFCWRCGHLFVFTQLFVYPIFTLKLLVNKHFAFFAPLFSLLWKRPICKNNNNNNNGQKQ